MTDCKKILIVDDDPQLLRGYERTFRARGYTVRTAFDGLEARRILLDEGYAPGSVLTDNIMPRMNGLSLLLAMHEAGLTKKMAVVLHSSTGDGDLGVAVRAFGVTYFAKSPDASYPHRLVDHFDRSSYTARPAMDIAVSEQ